jgi:hypothetical protein
VAPEAGAPGTAGGPKDHWPACAAPREAGAIRCSRCGGSSRDPWVAPRQATSGEVLLPDEVLACNRARSSGNLRAGLSDPHGRAPALRSPFRAVVIGAGLGIAGLATTGCLLDSPVGRPGVACLAGPVLVEFREL